MLVMVLWLQICPCGRRNSVRFGNTR